MWLFASLQVGVNVFPVKMLDSYSFVVHGSSVIAVALRSELGITSTPLSYRMRNTSSLVISKCRAHYSLFARVHLPRTGTHLAPPSPFRTHDTSDSHPARVERLRNWRQNWASLGSPRLCIFGCF